MATQPESLLVRVKKTITGNIERFFYWYGSTIGKNPRTCALICLLFVCVSCIGLIRFRQERNPLNLWIPPKSDFKHDTDWIMETFKEGFRSQYLLITAPNVLDPQVIYQLEQMRRKILAISVNNVTYEQACFRIPAVKLESIGIFDLLGRRKKRSFFFFGKNDPSEELGYDPSLTLSSSSYCRIVNKLPKVCLEMNIPQLWSNDLSEIDQLTLEDVVNKLNSTALSPVTGHAIAFPELLGGIERDPEGKIVGAKSLLSIWMTHVNFSEVNMEASGNDAGTSDWATQPILDWEAGYIELLQNETKSLKNSNITIHFEAGRSYADISGESMFQDMGKLFIGGTLMFLFVQFILTVRCNRVEMRFWLGCVGLICVLLSFVATVGICSCLGIPYGPVHTSLPFLLLGIGVDDVFVITSCWNNLEEKYRKQRLDQQIGTALKHAGVSITVTSATNFVAFLVGSFTILPCLQSFCLYAAMGILIMFIFQASLFVAVLALDAERTDRGRNCFFWCMKSSYVPPKEPSHKDFLQSRAVRYIFDKVILTTPVKVLIFLMAFGITGVAIVGNTQLKQRFEPEWFLPNNSYLLQFITTRRTYYPDLGMDGAVFVGMGNYSEDFKTIHELSQRIASEHTVLKVVDSWTDGFILYAQKLGVDALNASMTESQFKGYLSGYLWSPSGARFQKNFRFETPLICGEPAPAIQISSIDFIFRRFSGPEEYIPGKNELKRLVAHGKLPRAAVWAKIFANWVTDEVIDHELYRNLGMAILCVTICTAVFLADLTVCSMIFLCVLLTVIDVAGLMYFWGLYIDIASCIALVLAVGLCVDYASHIGHTFLRMTGSRHERVLNTVEVIGVASINGGISTLLALSILGFSDAYIFTTFFKIFLLVVLIGMFHGIVFLPVMLSLLGPPPFIKELREASAVSREMEELNSQRDNNTDS